jgi:hypothetical protein
MNNEMLYVTIQKNPRFYTLYADGREDTITDSQAAHLLLYPAGSIVFLYYTFPTHRRVYCIHNTESPRMSELPGLSKPITILFQQYASRVDKTKKAVSYLRAHYPSHVFLFEASFYYRLAILLEKKGKLDYCLLDLLVQRSLNGRTAHA